MAQLSAIIRNVGHVMVEHYVNLVEVTVLEVIRLFLFENIVTNQIVYTFWWETLCVCVYVCIHIYVLKLTECNVKKVNFLLKYSYNFLHNCLN